MKSKNDDKEGEEVCYVTDFIWQMDNWTPIEDCLSESNDLCDGRWQAQLELHKMNYLVQLWVDIYNLIEIFVM